MPSLEELTYRSDPSMNFDEWWLKRRRLALRMYLLRICSHGSPFRELKTPNFGVWIGVFKPNSWNRKTCILSKLLHNSNQILHSDKDHQMPFVGGPNTRITNQDGGRPPSWKNKKSPYLGPQFERFQRNLALWCSSTLLTVPTVWPIITKFGMVMQFDTCDTSYT